MMHKRHLLMGVALVATLLASYFDFPQDVEPQAPARAAGRSQPALQAAATAPAAAASDGLGPVRLTAATARPVFAAATADLFRVHSWQPPPPPPPSPGAAAAPLDPVMPPMPFRYLGKLVQDGGVAAFVSLGNTTHVLRSGDVVAGYRVASVSAAGMDLVYLQLDKKQHLSFGSAP